MNTIGMISQQVTQSGDMAQKNTGKKPDKSAVFQGFLTDEQTSVPPKTGSRQKDKGQLNSADLLTLLNGSLKMIDSEGKEKEQLNIADLLALLNQSSKLQGFESQEQGMLNIEDLAALLKNLPGISEQLTEKILNSEDIQGLSGVDALEEIINKFEKILGQTANEQDRTEDLNINPELMNIQMNAVAENDGTIQQQLAAIFKQAKEVLGKITNGETISKTDASALLKLLEQWTSLAKKLSGNKAALDTLVSGKGTSGTKEQAMWRELVQFFQKRNQFVTNQQYNTNAKVTSNDVAKLLQKVLSDQTQVDKAPSQHMSASSMPMSKVEQYVIYMNQNQNSQTVDQQLIEQFQKVMKTSKFLSMNNGTSQLSIALKPDNLGEMMVKLTQINGEMTVKIMVTSQAAKDMLESNMHQLKHMFSPQQVVIEKQDLNTNQAQNFQGEQENQSMNEQEQDQGQAQHSNDDDSSGQQQNDFETQFQEVLMNEKV
ncbi:flagellar hook-length control protein FliK [Virgibacillus sp. FSP13]